MVKVKVEQGWLEGEVVELCTGEGKYYSFKGIPYARPPVDELRFQAPQPPETWAGVRPAKEHGPICYQFDMFSFTVLDGSEDCLYLNVYTPDLNPSKPLSVMVWIHGGGFFSGSGNSDFYGPDFLVRQDVIVITLNYRLEVLGFLCLHTKDIPGNAGMKDQVAALKWIKNNIGNFGGDPNNITLFGESAGGASVSFHLVSPMSKGLFNRAIIQSGCLLNGWATSFEPRVRAEIMARKLGKYTTDDKELCDFFKKLPKEQLINVNAPISTAEACHLQILLQFSVVSEKDFGQERFFYDDPNDMLPDRVHDNVDVMIGYTIHEGIVMLGLVPDLLTKVEMFFECFVPETLTKILPTSEQLEVGRVIRNNYFDNRNVTTQDVDVLIDVCSMKSIVHDTLRWLKQYTTNTKSKCYLYEFGVCTERNDFLDTMYRKMHGDYKLLEKKSEWCGHCADILYLFNMLQVPVENTSQIFSLIDTITKLWTNFAKFSNPTPDDFLEVIWPEYQNESQQFLYIGNTLTVRSQPIKNKIDLWDSIYTKYLHSASGHSK